MPTFRRFTLALLLPALGATPLTAASPTTLRYAVVSFGKTVGSQTVSIAGDELRIEFEFNDRGRGPKIEQSIRLGRDLVPTSNRVRGLDYLKSPVDESFAVRGGRAIWKSAAEAGEAAVGASPAFYLSGSGSPYEIGLLVKALERRPDRRLALLPVGEASLGAARPVEVELNGQQRLLRRVDLVGLGFSPNAVWLDQDGELFGFVSAWSSIVRVGGEPLIDRLVAIDREAATAHWRDLASRASRRSNGVLALRNTRLFDSATLAVREGSTVLVEGDRVVAVGEDTDPAIASVLAQPGVEVVDAGGRTLIPGLWDMHVHVGDVDGPLHLLHGVTTVRDLANDVDELAELTRQWSSGEALGPRVIAAGFIDGPGPYAGPSKALVDTVDGGVEWIRRYAGLGYRQIKLYSSLKPELVAPLAREAHRLGLRVSGHVPATMTAEQAIRAGYDELQHVNFVVLNFFPEITETRTPARFTEVAARAAGLDAASPQLGSFFQLLRDRGIVVDPTVNAFETMFRDRPGVLSVNCVAVADRLPATVRRGCLTGGLPVPEGMDETYRRSADRLKDLVFALWKAGVTLVAGTDDLAGVALHRELEIWQEAGIPPAEILRLATLGAARVMGRDGDLGRVAAGYHADLVLIDGRPDESIADLRRVWKVVSDGRLIDVDQVARTLGMRPPL